MRWIPPIFSAAQCAKVVLQYIHLMIREVHVNIATIGIDLAKTSFSLVEINKHDKVALRKMLSRNKLLSFIAQCLPYLIGLGEYSGAHYWPREVEKLGHEPLIIAIKFIKPYSKDSKNDNNYAEAFCEAARRPNICFVPVKAGPINRRHFVCTGRIRMLRARSHIPALLLECET